MATVLVDIVEQHAEEAAFLWHLRDFAVDRPHYAPRHLARLEERLEAHLDGLRTAAATGLELAQAELDRYPEPAAAYVLAVLLLEVGESHRFASLLDLARAEPSILRGIAGALGWVGPARLRGRVGPWLDSDDPLERRLGLIACSLHRVDPQARLERLVEDPEPAVRARALRLAAEVGRCALRPALLAALADPDRACRLWASWSAVRLGERGTALEVLAREAEEAEPDGWPALDLAVRAMVPAEAAGWIRALDRDPRHARRVIRATGALGDPAVVPWLVARMDEPAHARLLGEAFTLLTGIDLAYEDLDRPPLVEPAAGPTDDPEDENVALDPDEHLPWPDRTKVAARWAQETHRFARRTRHLLGRPVDGAACARAFAEGYQRQRRAAALEWALLEPATPMHAWRARLRA